MTSEPINIKDERENMDAELKQESLINHKHIENGPSENMEIPIHHTTSEVEMIKKFLQYFKS